MDLKRNDINIKVININEYLYLLITDLTISIIHVDHDILNSLNPNTLIEYRDVCNIILDSSSKVLTNDTKLKALLSFITRHKELFTKDLLNSLYTFTELDMEKFSKKESKIIRLLTDKLNKAEKRYQDRRRVERMIKEFKYYIIDIHNNNIHNNRNTKAKNKILSNIEIYLHSLIDINKDNIITIPLKHRGVCHIKESNLYKSKYTQNMSSEELVHLLYKCTNQYRKIPMNYNTIISKVYPKNLNIKVRSAKIVLSDRP